MPKHAVIRKRRCVAKWVVQPYLFGLLLLILPASSGSPVSDFQRGSPSQLLSYKVSGPDLNRLPRSQGCQEIHQNRDFTVSTLQGSGQLRALRGGESTSRSSSPTMIRIGGPRAPRKLRCALFAWESLHTVAAGGVAPHVTELAAGLER